MVQAFYDISRTISPRSGTWPGDVTLSVSQTFAQHRGDMVNVGCLQMSIHTGTHIDAPFHFDSDGEKSDQLDLAAFWGMAQVVTVEREPGPLEVQDLAEVNLTLPPRLLLHTPTSRMSDETFPSECVYPSVGLVETLARAGIILLGTDAPSVDALSDRNLPGHAALYRHGISILEGLNLSGVLDGLYELSALPLKLEMGDGSPVRAVLRTRG